MALVRQFPPGAVDSGSFVRAYAGGASPIVGTTPATRELIGSTRLLAVPVAVLANDGWLANPTSPGELWKHLDDAEGDDGVGVYATTSGELVVGLNPIADPAISTNHKIVITTLAYNAVLNLIELRQGATVIASRSLSYTPNEYATYEFELTGVEADSITDYANLSLALQRTLGTVVVKRAHLMVEVAGATATGDLSVGGGATQALEGAATAEVTATGSVSVSVPLAAAGISVSTAEGAMSITIPLAGAGVAEAVAAGELYVASGGTLEGSATAEASSSGALSVTIPLSGEALTQALAQAGIVHGVTLSGEARATEIISVARPTSTVDGVGYTPVGAATIHECIGEVVPDDGTYIYGSSDGVVVALSPITDPGTSTGHIVRYRVWATSGWAAIELRQGTTSIASRYHIGGSGEVTGTPQTLSFELTKAEADSITNYGDLRLMMTGLLGTTYFSWVEFAVEDYAVDAAGSLSKSATLSGAARAVATATGAVSLQFSLSGLAIAEAIAAGNLSFANLALVGTAQAQASASASLSKDIALHGTAASLSTASGGITRHLSLLGVSASASMATGGIDIVVKLDSDSLAEASASGGLNLVVDLSSAAIAEAIAAGALFEYGVLVDNTPGWEIVREPRVWGIESLPRDWEVAAVPRVWDVGITPRSWDIYTQPRVWAVSST